MIKEIYNKTLHEVVLKIFTLLEISKFPETGRMDLARDFDNSRVQISCSNTTSRYEHLHEYRFMNLHVVFNIIENKAAKHGYTKTDDTEGFTLWGYLKLDFTDFIPEDFTHFAPGLNNGKGWDNFFRDHLDIPEAKESIARFKERVETL